MTLLDNIVIYGGAAMFTTLIISFLAVRWENKQIDKVNKGI